MNKYLTLFLIIGICSAGTFFTNGDFEQNLSAGWFEKLNGSNITINRRTSYDNSDEQLPNGIYFVKLATEDFEELEKIIILK